MQHDSDRKPTGRTIAIIKGELLRRRWTTIWWITGIAAFITLTLAVYPTFRNQSAQIDQSLQQIPKSAKSLITDTSDFLSPVGYLSSQVYYLLLPLLFSILAIALGSSLIAREEQRHTIELLLARPVSRAKLLLGKAAAGLIVLVRVGAATAAISVLEVWIIKFDGVHLADILLVTLMSLILALLFGAVAFTLTATGSLGRGASIGVAVLLGLGGYIISSLEKTVTWLRWPAKFLPFHYYHPADILNGHFTGWEALGMLAVAGALIALATVAFRRRDIG